jgi:hypothetical protein
MWYNDKKDKTENSPRPCLVVLKMKYGRNGLVAGNTDFVETGAAIDRTIILG